VSKLVLAIGIALALLFAACETEPATDVSYFSAKLNGKGNCQGTYDVEWWYQYGTVGSTEWTDAPHHNFHCTGVSAPFTIPPEQIGGLTDGVIYRFRLAATVNGGLHYYDANGTTDGTSYDTFATLPFPRVTPKSAQAFRDSEGVNSRIAFSGTPWADFAQVKAAVGYTGIRYLRETWRNWLIPQYRELAVDEGVKFSFGLGRLDPDGDDNCGPFEMGPLAAQMRTDATVRAAIKYIESPNEINGSDGEQGINNWEQCVRDFLAAQEQLVNGEWQIVGPTVIGPNDTLGNVEQWVDFGNMHPYPGGLPPDDAADPDNGITFNLPKARVMTPTKPIFATETGYHTNEDNTSPNAPVPEAVQGKYMVRLMLEAFRRDLPHTDIYGLVEKCTDEVGTNGFAYGLYRCDWTKKPAADAMHNLNATVGSGSPALTQLAMRVDSGPSDLRQVVLRRSDGAYVVALWRYASLWNRVTRQTLVVTPQDVTLTLPYANSVGSVRPNQSATETGLTLNANKQVTVPVAGEAVLLVVR
jgi:hypothetical protein